MNDVNVLFAKEAKEKIIQGVNMANQAIQATYGPNGNNVLISTPAGIISTKDGKTVAINLQSADPYIQIGINLMSEASQKMADTVGDASTTVCVLINRIVEEFKEVDNPISLFRLLNEAKERVLEELEKVAIPVTNKEELVNVATVTANNDKEIGNIVADAYEKVGKEGIVRFEESEEINDRLSVTKGFSLENGYSSPYFINTTRNTCELDDVYVHVQDTKMEEVKEVVKLADQAMKLHKSLLLIAPGFDSEIYVFLKANLDVLKSCTVITPNYRNFREIITSDILDILGETHICNKVICDSNSTTLIGYTSNQGNIEGKVKAIRESISNNAYNAIELEFNQKRLANFVSSIATIYVGGYTTTERKNRLALVEDSVLATKQAMIGGYIAGGGKGLAAIANKSIEKACDNFTYSYITCLCKLQEFLGTQKLTEDDMYKQGIIEPALVTKEYLNSSLSIASQILSCGCAVINNKQTYF